MRIWKIAAIAALGLTSFAADNVAPTKAELEEMYNTAYRAFDAGKFPEALKQLDAIDARQPDLAASKNLRGVILMRQGNYDQAEAALTEAARIDPKFWNARFNLAEIPFLKKDWAEARKRFEQLLSTGQSDLAKEASQLIQYKILLTYLMEGKSNMVDSILAKLELSPDTPSVDYVKAAVALQQKNQAEAKDWISAAEKNYSPQLNKLFVESLYEIGWMEKPVGQRRASLPLMTAAERTEKAKALARSKFEQSQQAFRQRDFATALKLVDEADKADPNQPATLNLRGEILMQQGQFDDAEGVFKNAAKLDPKLRDAQYNLAQIPFKKKDYAKARDRFETLYKRIPGGDKNQAAELIKFKIYMTLLMEGKESPAHSMMEEFQFTGDTPALYYAQAAWEYKHNNPQKAEDWTNSANKIYSAALNGVFADAFYDVGWLQRPEGTTAPAVAFDTSNVATSQVEGGPAVEPSPIPDKVLAANKQDGTLSLAPSASAPGGGMELASTRATANQPSLAGSKPAGNSPLEQPAVAQSSSTSAEPTVASQPVTPETASASTATSNQNQTEQPAAAQTSPPEQTSVRTTPAKVSPTTAAGVSSRRIWIVGGLLLAAVVLIALAILPALRRYKFAVPGSSRPEPSPETAVFKPNTAPAQTTRMQGNGFAGGPRQVSLQLKPWKPALRESGLPSAKTGGALDRLKALKPKPSAAPAHVEPQGDESAPVAVPFFESVGPVLEQATGTVPAVASQQTGVDGAEPVTEFAGASRTAPQLHEDEILELPEESVFAAQGPNEFSEHSTDEAVFGSEQPNEVFAAGDAHALPGTEAELKLTAESSGYDQPDETIFAEREAFAERESFTEREAPVDEIAAEPVSDFRPPPAIPVKSAFPQTTTPATIPETAQTPPAPIAKARESLTEREAAVGEIAAEPPSDLRPPPVIPAKPALPQTTTAATIPETAQTPPAPIAKARESLTEREAAVGEIAAEPPSDLRPPPVIPAKPALPQTTTTATMPETTQTPPASVAKAPGPPLPVAKPQPPSQSQPQAPAAGIQTSVQLTFSFEIAAMQLTPSFKMGVLKVRPISKLVTMRLPSPQREQSPLNLQVAFELVKIQPVAGALGTIRVVPSQQQRPAMGGMPSFAVAGLQVVPNSETAPVQLTPSPQGRASVFVTVPFQVSTLEFSPTLEIGSVTLNSNSKQVVVQLPGTGPGPVEGAPMFEIANLELNEGGEIVMMQLNLLSGLKRA